MFLRSIHKILVVFFLLLGSLLLRAESQKTPSFSELAERKYIEAGLRYQAQPTNTLVAWEFSKSCFDFAEFADSEKQREKISNEGIDAARKVIADQPKSTQGHYYLAMNLGQLARTKSIGALRIVDEMETEFKTVLQLDEKFDFAGANRNLGMLYHEAPGWPASIGSRKNARLNLERARELAPDFPENHLYLLEAYIKWGDKAEAQKEYNTLKKLWPQMKEKLSDERWTRDWLEWEKRWRKIQERFGK